MRKLFIIFLLILMSTVVSAQWPYNNKPMLGEQLDQTHPLGRPVSFWPFNEGSGNKVFDLSGNGNHGVIQADSTWAVAKFGSGIKVTGQANDGIIIPDSPSVNSATGPGQPRTWAYWINITTLTDNELITDKSDFGGLQLWSEEQVIGGNYSIDGGVAVVGALTTGAILVANTWYYVVFTYDGANARLYINGVLIDGPNAQTAAAVNANDIQIMKKAGNVPTAVMDNFAIWRRALSASEVALLNREPFCMFAEDDIALMAAGVPAPTGGQIIMIQMTACPVIIFFVIYIRQKYRKAA